MNTTALQKSLLSIFVATTLLFTSALSVFATETEHEAMDLSQNVQALTVEEAADLGESEEEALTEEDSFECDINTEEDEPQPIGEEDRSGQEEYESEEGHPEGEDEIVPRWKGPQRFYRERFRKAIRAEDVESVTGQQRKSMLRVSA